MHLAAITLPVNSVVNLVIRACENLKDVYAATCYEGYSGIGGICPYLA
jgi:sphingomyelin phosphodiesterase